MQAEYRLRLKGGERTFTAEHTTQAAIVRWARTAQSSRKARKVHADPLTGRARLAAGQLFR